MQLVSRLRGRVRAIGWASALGEHGYRADLFPGAGPWPVLVALLLLVGCGNDGTARGPQRGAQVASPVIEGPVSGGKGSPFIASTTFDLARVGYSEAEYFISGTASAYTNVGPLGEDGRWVVEPAATAAYKTRILVYRPTDRQAFNGTVLVEWLNVSGGLDAAPDWIITHTELARSGYAWVGVSAQRLGVEGGGVSLPGIPSMPLKASDPERYGSLVHPGDSFSYDIFSQAAQAIRRPSGPKPLGDLRPERVVAIGESQSAFALVTYVDAEHPRADIYDGFFIHSRGNFAYPLSGGTEPWILPPGTVQIRDDTNVPVLTFETETDLTGLDYFPARQPDADRFRLWEVAGTAHADTYVAIVGREDLGDSPDAAAILLTTSAPPVIQCSEFLNAGPQHHFVANAAIHALDQWIRHGTPPPVAPRLEVSPGSPPSMLRDAHGNGQGGIRTPYVDVPVATLSGEAQPGSTFCFLFGSTKPFDAAEIASLYTDHEAYVSAVTEATDRAVAQGFILPPDAELVKAAAAASEVGSGARDRYTASVARPHDHLLRDRRQ